MSQSVSIHFYCAATKNYTTLDYITKSLYEIVIYVAATESQTRNAALGTDQRITPTLVVLRPRLLLIIMRFPGSQAAVAQPSIDTQRAAARH